MAVAWTSLDFFFNSSPWIVLVCVFFPECADTQETSLKRKVRVCTERGERNIFPLSGAGPNYALHSEREKERERREKKGREEKNAAAS